jgi:hypothetical protein
MAVTPLQYDDIVDIRWDPFANGGIGDWQPFGIGQPSVGFGSRSAEIRQIPASAPYRIKLYELPQLNLPSTTDITLEIGGTQLQEVSVSDSPGNLEYRVVYPDALGAGEAEFNLGQAGQNVIIRYYGLGHIIQKISLDTRVPDTGNTTIGGNKTFTGDAYLLDQVGVGTITPAATNRTHIIGTSVLRCLELEATTTLSSTNRNILKLKATTSANMGDGHGCNISFHVEDDADIDNTIGLISMERVGADDQGEFILQVNDGVALRDAIKIRNNTIVDMTFAGIRTKFRAVDIGAGVPSDADLDGVFGTPLSVNFGFIAILRNLDDNVNYLIVSNGANWYYLGLNLAV